MTRCPGLHFLSALLFSCALSLAPAIAAAQSSAAPAAAPQSSIWVASWAASQQIPEPANALPAGDLRDPTLRQIVHRSVGGSALRVHLSNAFGIEALHFTSVHIARPI